MTRLQKGAFTVVVGVVCCARFAAAQTTPVEQSNAPAAPSTPLPATGPTYGTNDPCTSIGAIVSRPSVTTSVCTVRSNHVLIETGYQNTASDATSTAVQYPQAFVRVGTKVPALEIDLGLPAFERLHDAGGVISGFTDIGVGAKYVLGYTPRFNYGASVFFTAPTGSRVFSAGGATQALNVNFGYMVNSVLSVTGTLGANALSNGVQHYGSFIPSLVVGAAVTSTTGVFIEGAQFTNAAGPATPTRTQLLGGVTHDLGARLQIDLEAGRSPTSATGKYRFIGFGVSSYL